MLQQVADKYSRPHLDLSILHCLLNDPVRSKDNNFNARDPNKNMF